MGMHAEQREPLSSQTQKKLNDSMTEMVWDVRQASNAVVALSEMMQEYSAIKNWSHDAIYHVEHGMWLCSQLGSHQQELLERLETALIQYEPAEASESLVAGHPSLSDSMSAAARSEASAPL